MLAQELITQLDFGNPNIGTNLTVMLIGTSIAYLIYMMPPIIMMREKKNPYPIWLHTFYLACDSFGVGFWYILAKQNDWFWFFCVYSVGMFVFCLMELFILYQSVKHERQEAYGDLFDKPVTTRNAYSIIFAQYVIFFSVIALNARFMGGLEDAALFKLYTWTNYLTVYGPMLLLYKRKSRIGTSVLLNIMLLLGAIVTYLPPGLGFSTTMSAYFDEPWFYIAGIVTTIVAVYNLVYVLKLPAKPKILDGKKTVW